MAEKVVGYCKSKCVHEVYSKDCFCVKSGRVSINNNSYTDVTLNYPLGFTRDNCMVIGYLLRDCDMGYVLKYPTDNFNNNNPLMISLDSSSINLTFKPSSGVTKYDYKIMLFRYYLG